MGLLYLPTNLPSKSPIHVGKYTMLPKHPLPPPKVRYDFCPPKHTTKTPTNLRSYWPGCLGYMDPLGINIIV